MTVSIMQESGVAEQLNLDRDYTVMTYIELPDNVQHEIREFLSYVKVTRDTQEDFD